MGRYGKLSVKHTLHLLLCRSMTAVSMRDLAGANGEAEPLIMPDNRKEDRAKKVRLQACYGSAKKACAVHFKDAQLFSVHDPSVCMVLSFMLCIQVSNQPSPECLALSQTL